MSNKNRTREKHPTNLIRTFICIEIPESIKTRIDLIQQKLKAIDAQVSWTKPSNIHLTLKFLGGVEASRVEHVIRAVERAVSGVTRFRIEVRGTGCFPSTRSPRVFWVGLPEVSDNLKRLYSSIDEELAGSGFARETRKFTPHLTIGRLRTPQNGSSLAEALISDGFETESFTAKEVIVMRSELKPTGSIYTPQAVIPLSDISK